MGDFVVLEIYGCLSWHLLCRLKEKNGAMRSSHRSLRHSGGFPAVLSGV